MNVLLLTHRLPYAPNRGDRVRAYFLLQELKRFANVDLVSLVHDAEEASHADDLRALVSSVRVAPVRRRLNMLRSLMALPGRRPTTHTMLDSPQLSSAVSTAVDRRPPDVVLAYCSGMARLALEPPLQQLPFVLDMVDVDSAKWQALADVSRPPLGWIYRREFRVLRRFEARAAAHASATLVVTEQERDTLRAIAPEARIEVVPNGVDADALRPPDAPADTKTVVFCGVMDYAPNEQAALLLAQDVWPLVRRREPEAQLMIVGASPTPSVMALAATDRGVVVTGSVPDVKPYLWSAAVGAAPIVTARGIQNKVLEAVAAGLPVVVTPNIYASLPDVVRPACVSAPDAPGLAEAIVTLLRLPPAKRRARAAMADVGSLTWRRQLQPVEGLLRDAIARRKTSAQSDARTTVSQWPRPSFHS